MQEAARRPADAQHGLWLLVPVDRVNEWAVLDGLSLKELRALGS